MDSAELDATLKGIAAGSQSAVTALYRHYQTSLFAFIRSQGLDEGQAEEVLNDTFLVVCRSPHSFDRRSKFSTWLCGIAKFKSIDRLRASSRRPPDSSHESEEALSVPDLNADVLSQLEDEELQRIMQHCFEELSAAQRFTAHLFYYDGRSIEEIAEELQLAAGTAKSRLFNARKAIADCIQRRYASGGQA